MKKIIKRTVTLSLVLSLLLSLCNFGVIPVYAEEETTQPVEFTITSVKGVSGKTVDVEVRISENSQVCAADWELQFDSSELLFKEFEGSNILSVGMYAYNANISDCVKVSFSSLEPIAEGGTLFKVTFLVTGENYNENLEIKLVAKSLVTTNSNDAAYTVHNGYVEIVDLLYGDVDLDNRVSTVDVLRVLCALTEETPLTEEEKKIADVNGDGEVSAIDALQILYFTAELGDNLYITEDERIDFFIYNLHAPTQVYVSELNEYNFTVAWEEVDYAIGYNIYFDGQQVNQYMLTDTQITIGCAPDGTIVGDPSIAPLKHNSIDQNSTHTVEISAINALKESEKSEVLTVTTKRHHSGVTFKNWDGTILDQQKVLYGQDAVAPNAPKKEGYTFIGWDKPTTNIVEDTVITALFQINTYDYVFYDWDNREIARQTVVYQGTATPPANPTRRGYTFNGWYTALTGGSQATDFSNVTASRNFYAQYTVNQYSVSFQSNGGTAVSSKTADYSTTISAPANPTRYSYVFGGWYKDATCQNKWDFQKDTVKENTTLYAKWVPIVITIDRPSLTFTAAGNTEQLSVSFSSGSDTIKWYSDNGKVATVDENTGLVTSVGHGTANIYIQGQNSERRAVCKVTVVARKDAWVTATVGLNMRASASTSAPILKLIPYNVKIDAFGEPFAEGDRNDWVLVSYDGKTGYAAAEWLTFTEPQISNNVGALTGTFAERLEYLKNVKFPNGKYWNHYANGGHNNWGPFYSCTNEPNCMNSNGVTDHPCTSHSTSVGVGGYDCNAFNGAIQCAGFSQKIYFDLYGFSPFDATKSVWYQNVSFNDIHSGDHLWYYGADTSPEWEYDQAGNLVKGSGHQVFVIEKHADYIVVVEANYGANCQIRWNRIIHASDIYKCEQIARPL